VDVDLLLQALEKALPDTVPSPQVVPIDELFLTLTPECIRPAIHLMVTRFDILHLSVITGEDMGDEIVLLYHFWDQRGLTLRTTLPSEQPQIATITDLMPGADFYEREVAEMLGVRFEGYPDPLPLLLPDDWDAPPPLRKAAADSSDSVVTDKDQEQIQ